MTPVLSPGCGESDPVRPGAPSGERLPQRHHHRLLPKVSRWCMNGLDGFVAHLSRRHHPRLLSTAAGGRDEALMEFLRTFLMGNTL